MIVVVSDIYADQMTGGAELTSDALLESGFNNYKKINSLLLTTDLIQKYRNKRWIFFNFHHVNDTNLLHIVKQIKNYHVVEYDYKYCKFRLKSKHEHLEGICECQNSKRGKLVAVFLAKSKNLFFMSHAQKSEYERVFPVLKRHKSSHVLSSSFTSKSIEYVLSLNTSKKNNKYLILNSKSWVKGTKECIAYAKENKIDYKLVANLSHRDLLAELAKHKGLIFLPRGLDTCPRLVMEAKLLGCDVILNENVQHKDELWFKDQHTIIEHIRKQKNFFYERVLKQHLPYEGGTETTRFHFITPGYNVSEWLEKSLRSIKKQEYKNYSVTFINDVSEDDSAEAYNKIVKSDPKFKIVSNETKKYALKNISEAIKNLDASAEDVIIVLDADDWLSSPYVLDYLNYFYQENDCLMTYGSYMYYPTGELGVEPSDYPEDVIKNNSYREDKWRATHLRTFKKKLWDKIDQDDFIDEHGEYYKMAYDQAMMLPMLEMAGERAKYTPEVLHVYNRANVLNVDKIKQKEQHETMLRIRKRKKYDRVDFED
mgnify:FL=1|tara:strand:+ start:4015 stop:5634 length:1620 start_codon:yes stop_codon:yes gene_type:complete